MPIDSTVTVPIVRGPDRPNTSFIADFVAETCEYEDQFFIDGDVVDVHLSNSAFTIPPATLIALPPTNPDRRYPWYNFTIILHLHPSSETIINQPFILPGLCDKHGDDVQLSLSPNNPYAASISHNPTTNTISLQVRAPPDNGDEDEPPEHTIYLRNRLDKSMGKESPFFKAHWHAYTCAPNPEGVIVVDNAVPSSLVAALRAQTDALAAKEPVDWHPNSNDCVRDLVHPSLYPFVRGESALTLEGEKVLDSIVSYQSSLRAEGHEPKDRWGRLFEPSVYQWLPTVFRTDEKGGVKIEGYINNLDRQKYPELYCCLERLFECSLPMFEQVYSYAKELRFVQAEMFDCFDEAEYAYRPDIIEASLKGRALGVIVKIVEYDLRDESSRIEGAFHVEGMSSDHILATASYTLRRDEAMEGAELEFRRAFLDFEGWHIYYNVPQCRHWKAEEIVDEGVRPLGSVSMDEGRMVVFPNSHIHKLSTMRLKDGAKEGKRRVVVFWLVDPEAEVVTTQHVPIQQCEDGMTRERALWHRLQLMEERRKHKGKFNTERKIQLCEH